MVVHILSSRIKQPQIPDCNYLFRTSMVVHISSQMKQLQIPDCNYLFFQSAPEEDFETVEIGFALGSMLNFSLNEPLHTLLIHRPFLDMVISLQFNT